MLWFQTKKNEMTNMADGCITRERSDNVDFQRQKSVRVAFKTLGCKLNFSETATLERRLAEQGYIIVPFESEAEVYIINTCAVTEQAGRKCRYYVHHVRQKHPAAKLVLIGCLSQLKAEALQKELQVEMVLGSNSKFELPQRLAGILEAEPYLFENEKQTCFYGAYSLQEERTRSFLKVQDGCDYYCTYCTIPFARGHFRSGDVFSLVNDAKDIVRHGIKEIVLSGVNIGAYHTEKGERFFELLQALSSIEGLQRIRISSIEPDLLSEQIIALVAERKNIMPHFHIPLQAGCDSVLARMKRRYDTRLYADKVALIRKQMPQACIAADVIVGFPGETEQEFSETENFVRMQGITYLHVFPYSVRPNTVAATMPNQVAKAVKRERVRRLMALSAQKKMEFYHASEGQTAQVLVESKVRGNDYCGFTENYIKVKLHCSEKEVNTIQKVRLSEICTDGMMRGEMQPYE